MSPLDAIVRLLEEYAPLDEGDHRQRDTILHFVVAHPDCCDRSLLEGHLTGSAWLVNAGGDKVLLTHHKKLNKWLQLGGHADGDPDLLNVARREAQEESGLMDVTPVFPGIFDLDVHPIPARPGEPAHLHYDVRFALQSAVEGPLRLSGESNSLAWVPVDEITALTSEPSMLRMAKKWQRRGAAGAPR